MEDLKDGEDGGNVGTGNWRAGGGNEGDRSTGEGVGYSECSIPISLHLCPCAYPDPPALVPGYACNKGLQLLPASALTTLWARGVRCYVVLFAVRARGLFFFESMENTSSWAC